MSKDKDNYKKVMKRLAELMDSPEGPPLLAQVDRYTGELRRKVATINATNEELQHVVTAQREKIAQLDILRTQVMQLQGERTGLAADCEKLRHRLAEAQKDLELHSRHLNEGRVPPGMEELVRKVYEGLSAAPQHLRLVCLAWYDDGEDYHYAPICLGSDDAGNVEDMASDAERRFRTEFGFEPHVLFAMVWSDKATFEDVESLFQGSLHRCYAIITKESTEHGMAGKYPFFISGLNDDLSNEDRRRMAGNGRFPWHTK